MEKILKCKNVVLKYGTKEALHGINMEIEQDKITALIGPSGCGKSTLLKCFNRMHLDDNATVEGQILFNDQDIYDPKEDMVELRRQIGMVFQQPVPFRFPSMTMSPMDHALAALRISSSWIRSSKKVSNRLPYGMKSKMI